MAQKVRIYELSKTLGISNKEIMDFLEKEFKLVPKSHSSTIEHEVAEKITAHFSKPKEAPRPTINLVKAVKAPVVPPPQPEETPLKSDSPPVRLGLKQPTLPSVSKDIHKEPLKEPYKPVDSLGIKKVDSPAAKTASDQPYPGRQESPRPDFQKQDFQKRRPPDQRFPQQSPRPAAPAAIHSKPMDTIQPPKPQDSHKTSTAPVAVISKTDIRGRSTLPPEAPVNVQIGTTPPKKGMPEHPKKPQADEVGHLPPEKPLQIKSRTKEVKRQEQVLLEPEIKEVTIYEPLTVRELAIKLNKRETEIIKFVFMKGIMVNVNQTLDLQFAQTIAQELGYDVLKKEEKQTEEYTSTGAMDKKSDKKLDESKFRHLAQRACVVSIMGHVDHGKTSLLDAIRETRHRIVDTEAGGITQSIGAYTVDKDGHKIVFLDTPGHEAFTAMRMRGAKSTDIAILVVAADDGVMPQTIEAINHAKAANIPIIVAINKIDRENADPDRVISQLSEHGLVAEKWGGDTVMVEVSALQKLGLEDLLEMILLVSEVLELKADPTVPGTGVIIEAQLDKRMGPIASALVQNGTLKVGDNLLIGSVGGRVRALINDSGERIREAGPSTPVEILGLSDVPNAGDAFEVVTDDKKFRQLLTAEKERERENRLSSRVQFQGIANKQEDSDEIEFNVIIKADTQGSVEAVNDAVKNLSSEKIKINILHAGTGEISEADVMLASASRAVVIGFNVKEDANAQRIAEQFRIPIRKHDIIYHLIEELEQIILGKISPDIREVESGQAEVRQLFTVGKNVVIAGCMVTKGKIARNGKAIVTRDEKEIYSGTVSNLKRFKEDAREVAAGYECGISFDRFNDLQPGDLITVFVTEEAPRLSL